MRRHALSDAQWERIEDMLPTNGHRGRQWRDHRRVIDGIRWILQTGAPWRDLPERFGAQNPSEYSDLADQLRRAAMGPPRNIGEGAGKRTPADCRKYFDIARGSAMECGVHLDVCAVLRIVALEMIERGKAMHEREVAMLTRLSQSQGRPAQRS